MMSKELTYKERWYLAYGQTFDEWADDLQKKGEIIIPRCDLERTWDEQGVPKFEDEKTYFQKGYDDQCSRYPLLDHVWGEKKHFWISPKYPKKYQKHYRLGQVRAYKDGKADKPWFI